MRFLVRRRVRQAWVSALLLGFSGAGRAQELSAQELSPVVIACEPLDTEQIAEVEARIRAALLTSSVAGPAVAITCTELRAEVEVRTQDLTARVAVSPEAPGLTGRLLDGLEQALQDLAAVESPSKTPAPPPAPEVLPPPPPAPVPAKPDAPAPVNPPVGQAPRPPSIEFGLSAAGESWGGVLAVGGDLEVAYRWRQVSAGVGVGGSRASQLEPTFDATEGRSAVVASWQPDWGYGVQASAGVGVSLLSVAPRAAYTPRGSTTAAAVFAMVELARPFWIARHWAVAPRVFGRFFGARRNVAVDRVDTLVLEGVTPGVAVGVVYRAE